MDLKNNSVRRDGHESISIRRLRKRGSLVDRNYILMILTGAPESMQSLITHLR